MDDVSSSAPAAPEPRNLALDQDIGRLEQGDHICLIYETLAEQRAAVVPYLRNGVEAGERCVCIADERGRDEVLPWLEAAGIDVSLEQERGALVVLTERDTHLRSGTFDPAAMLAYLRAAEEEALAAGFSGLRVTGEMTWALGSESGTERLIEFEALVNRLLPGSRTLTICQYRRPCFPARVIRDVIRTHPIAVLGVRVTSNPFYEPPEMLLGAPDPAAQVEWMLGHLHRKHEMEEEKPRREHAEAVADVERAARVMADDANRAKDLFLATLSHELRTPLNAIYGWTRMLRTGQMDKLDTDRALEAIERNTVVQAQLVNDLLDVSRIIAGKLALAARPVSLSSAVGDAAGSLMEDAEARGVWLDLATGPAPCIVNGDPLRLHQIVTNLVSNAIKFTPRGGRVTVGVAGQGTRARITVHDTGRGIAPEALPHIFERFNQGSPVNVRSEGGLGLGLAIVRHLVELHGGSVLAESAGEGQGATFIVDLPLTGLAAPLDPQTVRVTESGRDDGGRDLRGIRVLVVDDDPDARELLGIVLRGHGAEVQEASSVAEAVGVLEASWPDALVSDLGLPDGDGYDLIRQVRDLARQSRGAMIPAIALTGFVSEDVRQRSRSAGYQRHVAKPIDPYEVAEIVADAVGR